MEMAGVTCLTGAHIIQLARELVERIGRPLELDTDGIWCMLPATFPENVTFTATNGKKITISYPCVMLNHLVHGRFTNHQYQDLVDPQTFKYKTHSDNTIFFEVDGPYRAMILPTSKEEDKNLKKRYAVFNHDGSLAELKGFEVKRRGELKLIKIFQTQIFKFFLEGTTLAETYASVAKVANRWLDVLHQHGSSLVDEELIDLICENRSMSKALEEYGSQKSTSITTAKRLAEFLGAQMVKDKGLNCKYIIAAKPKNAPVTERAIPVAIFSADAQVKRYFLRKWLREEPTDVNPRALIDWDYYLDRLGSVIQKLITIPAALQKVRNPVPRVGHPDWLQRRINVKDDRFKQKKMTDLFDKEPLSELSTNTLDHRLPTDLEDLGSTQLSKAKALSSQTAKPFQKRKAPDSVALVDPYASLPLKMPAATADYKGFLEYQKEKWKIQKQQRMRRRQLFGERNHAISAPLRGLLDNQADLLMSSAWQVLQVRESETPGDLRVFILIGNRVRTISVKVPRQLFLNLKDSDLPDVDIKGCAVEKVNHALPNGHPSVYLFKLVMSEDVYVRESHKLGILFNHPSVEGVYEKQIPLTIKAVLELGSRCTFDETQKGVLGRGLDQGFDLSSLKRISSKQPYLSATEVAFVFLCHLVVEDVQIFGLFSSLKGEANITMFNRSKNSQEMPKVKAEKDYRDLLSKQLHENEGTQWQNLIPYPESIRLKVTQVGTKRKLYLEVADALRKCRSDEGSKPMILVIQSPQERQLLHDVPSLSDLPVLLLEAQPSEGKMSGGERSTVKKLVTNYLAMGSRVSDLLELARYGDVPLCNVKGDDPRFLIDVAYARRLQKNNVVLWWSASSLPDHAGYEKDDILNPMETVTMPAINNSGTYSSVCIGIDIGNLVINTILTSSLINELEGIDSVAFNPAAPNEDDSNNGTAVLYSDNAFASAGVMALREMVKDWWAEACKGSSMADIMVQHLVRWVENPNSFLYDRSLHYYVQMISKKAFQQLMTDFRRVGSSVVFASANRLLLQTTKAEVANAYAYSQYILKSIKAKPLFHFLDLDIKEYWSYLVWYDEFNYGGKACAEVVEAEAQQLDLIMHWQLNTFQPIQYQAIFQEWVHEFIDLMHSLKHPGEEPINDYDESMESSVRLTQLPVRSLTRESDNPNALQDVLTRSISKPLKKQILHLIQRYRQEIASALLASDHAFPVLPGSHLSFNNTHPVLQLVKSIMHVLSLDRTINLEARYLRKELLAFFEIKEFSPQARFVNPSSSLRIEQIICEHCTMARNLDLCRDEDVLPDTPTSEGSPLLIDRKWACTFCGHQYDRLAIEERLVARVHKVLVEWQTQDLKCGKCRKIRVNDFMEHCGCSGAWVETVDKQRVVGDLKVLERVSGYYGLSMLGSVVAGFLRRL